MQASREAYQCGNNALGQALSDTAKQHKAEMGRLNEEAAEWIFASAYIQNGVVVDML